MHSVISKRPFYIFCNFKNFDSIFIFFKKIDKMIKNCFISIFFFYFLHICIKGQIQPIRYCFADSISKSKKIFVFNCPIKSCSITDCSTHLLISFCHNITDCFFSMFCLNKFNSLVTNICFIIRINIRHTYTFRIQKSLKNKPIFNRVNICYSDQITN